MTEALHPLHLPLRGSHLIEASAGTGKTWTIAALYLRLVLGHGSADAAPPQALAPAQILVMTFTKAATRELSDRIRARLVQAAACFRGQLEPPAHDDMLLGLLTAYDEGPAREAAAWRLACAAEAMDDAAVFTIDAWCQRMLREHAFDSGCLFDEELQADEVAWGGGGGGPGKGAPGGGPAGGTGGGRGRGGAAPPSPARRGRRRPGRSARHGSP